MRRASRLSIVLLTFLIGFVLHQEILRGEPPHPHRGLRGLPLVMGPWRGVEEALPPDIQAGLGLDDYILRSYRSKTGPPIALYIAYYGHEHLNERIHTPSACLPSGGWIPVETGHQEISVPDRPGHRVVANRYLIEKGLDRLVVLYWFQGRGRVVASDVMAKLYLAYDTLTGRGSDETLVRVSAPINDSPRRTLGRELRFIQRFFPSLQEFLAGS